MIVGVYELLSKKQIQAISVFGDVRHGYAEVTAFFQNPPDVAEDLVGIEQVFEYLGHDDDIKCRIREGEGFFIEVENLRVNAFHFGFFAGITRNFYSEFFELAPDLC